MRLIDADALDAVLRIESKQFGHGAYNCGVIDGLALARDHAKTALTIDAVPVVRCRECKHYSGRQCYHPNHDHHEQSIWVEEDYFCGWGQRREEVKE